MALDTIIDDPNATLLEEFTAYVAERVEGDVAPESFFRYVGLAIRDVLDKRNGAPAALRDAPAEHVIALSAYAPEIARSTLPAANARAVQERYTEFFSER